jgi:hypothetical protein
VKKLKQNGLDFEVDKLTNSIENRVTGDNFPIDITLNVDFIGGLGPLTKAEEIIISNYIKAQKAVKRSSAKSKIKTNSRKKALA